MIDYKLEQRLNNIVNKIKLNKLINQAEKLPAPNQKGVYALVNNGSIVYVGESKDIRKRLGQHLVEHSKWFNKFIVLAYVGYLGDYQRKQLETLLIQKYHPKYNVRKMSKAFEQKQIKHLTIKEQKENNLGVITPAQMLELMLYKGTISVEEYNERLSMLQ